MQNRGGNATLPSKSILSPKPDYQLSKTSQPPVKEMCGILFALWVGRHNNKAIEERPGVRGQAINTRVVKLVPVTAENSKTTVDERGDRPLGNPK